MLTIVLWLMVAALLTLWSGGLWLLHALLGDPQGAVLVLQRQLHALPSLEGLGEAAAAARDALVTGLDDLLLLASMGLGALQAALPGLAGWLAPLLWAAWGLGALLLLLCGAAFQSVLRDSARASARA